MKSRFAVHFELSGVSYTRIMSASSPEEAIEDVEAIYKGGGMIYAIIGADPVPEEMKFPNGTYFKRERKSFLRRKSDLNPRQEQTT